MKQPVVAHKLPPDVIVSLHVVIQPVLPREWFDSGTVRELVGGIRFLFYTSEQSHHRQSSASGGKFEEEARSEFLIPSASLDDRADVIPVEHGKKLFECSVKFCGKIGCTLLQVHAADVNVRCLPACMREFSVLRGHFVLESLTDEFPLQYEYEGQICRRVLDHTYMKGLMRVHKFAFVVLEDDCNSLQARERREVHFVILLRGYAGLMQHNLKLRNQQSARIHSVLYSIFVDTAHLSVEVPVRFTQSVYRYQHGVVATSIKLLHLKAALWLGNEARFMPQASHTDEDDHVSHLMPLVQHSPYTTYDKPADATFDLTPYQIAGGSSVSLASIGMKNYNSEPITVVPYSNLPIMICLTIVGGTSSPKPRRKARRPNLGSAIKNIQFTPCGDAVTLQPLQSMRMELLLTVGAHTAPLSRRAVEEGRSLTLDGTVLLLRDSFQVVRKNRSSTWGGDMRFAQEHGAMEACIKIFNVTGICAKPILKVATTKIDLGTLGAPAGWKSRRFEIEVRASAAIEVPFRVEGIPSWIKSITKSITPGDNVFVVTSQQSCKVEFVAETPPEEQYRSPGVVCFELAFINLANANQALKVSVSASFFYEVLRITQNDGEKLKVHEEVQEQYLYLSPVLIPRHTQLPDPAGVQNGAGCWITIHNVYHDTLRVRLQAKVQPELSGLLEVELASRSAFTTNEFILNPSETMDVHIMTRGVPGAAVSAPRLSNPFDVPHTSTSVSRSAQTLHSPLYIALLKVGATFLRNTFPQSSVSTIKREESDGVHYSDSVFLFSQLLLEPTLLAIPSTLEFVAPHTFTHITLRDAHFVNSEEKVVHLHNPHPSRPTRYHIEIVPARLQRPRVLLQDVIVDSTDSPVDSLLPVVEPADGIVQPRGSVALTVRLTTRPIVSSTQSTEICGIADGTERIDLCTFRVYDSEHTLHPPTEVAVKILAGFSPHTAYLTSQQLEKADSGAKATPRRV
jgi:hypothetical protein